MHIPPPYTITPEILQLLAAIEAKRIYFSSLDIPISLRDKIKRASILKSSLFSARIEGNPLQMTDINRNQSEYVKKSEVFNIKKAINFIEKYPIKEITKDFIIKLQGFVLKDISFDAGRLRHEISAIFNQAGVAVYLPPPPSEIDHLLDELFSYINKGDEKFSIITAFISHLIFEKIHPFLDGNGRVGRLLIGAVLQTKGWSFTFTIPFEEYLDENREEYYYHLDNGLRRTNDYLVFMLNAFLRQMEKTHESIRNGLSKKEQIFLPPRQEEILNIIKDHNVVSFDTIKRRFLKVPARTLRYDIKKLVDRGLVEKTGSTKGVYYRGRK